MRRSISALCLALTACGAASPTSAREPRRAGPDVPETPSPRPPGSAVAGGEREATGEADAPPPATLLRLDLDGERCALVPEERAVVAPPCVLDRMSHDVTCLLPDAAMPHFLALDPRRDAPPAGFTLSLVGPVRDVAASSTQLCVVDGNGGVSCRRPGGAPRSVPDLPPMMTIALGEGCGEILCGVSEAHELVCVATAARVGSVRVPGIAAVSVDGCTVCMAALDGRLACFGSATDAVPFASSPRVLPGVVCGTPGYLGDRDARYARP